jgi:hypothetical protein
MKRHIGPHAFGARLTSLLACLTLGVLSCAHPKPTPAAAVSAPLPPAAPEIDVSGEPSHHVALENQYLRALKVELMPNAATLKHRHSHDYVTVTFGQAELSNEVDGKPPANVKLEDGQVRFTEGGGPAHLVRNVGQAPFRNVTIELLQTPEAGAPPKWQEEHGVTPFHGGSREVLFVKGGMRVSKIDLQPGGVLPKRELTGPHFMVAVTDVDLQEEGHGKGTKGVQLKAGDVDWQEGEKAHKLANKAKQPTKIVLLEFK